MLREGKTQSNLKESPTTEPAVLPPGQGVSVLPNEHVPESLRKPEPKKRSEVVYAIGIGHNPQRFGMIRGPTPDLYQMLNIVPEASLDPICITRFNKDGTDDLLYEWDVSKWKRVVHKINE